MVYQNYVKMKELGWKTLGVSLPPDLNAKLRQTALEQGITLSKLGRQLMVRELYLIHCGSLENVKVDYAEETRMLAEMGIVEDNGGVRE